MLEALGLGQDDCPTSPPAVRRRINSPQQAPGACAKIMYPDGPAYLLKEPSPGAFPPSPFGLIEELLADDPWKLLIGCIMLNQTTRSQVSSRQLGFANEPSGTRLLRKNDEAARNHAVDFTSFIPFPLPSRSRPKMDRVLWEFLERFPAAEDAAAASVEEITQVVAPLGLQERRPVAIIRFSRERRLVLEDCSCASTSSDF